MAWYDSNWSYRVKITIASSQVDADLTDYPVYVDLSDLPSGFFSNVKSDGGDIRVTKSDGTTEVAREVVFITTGSSIGELHFIAAGTLSSSSDTDFYIYYGNSGASEPASSATYGSENVWNSNYAAVYHLQEDPSGTAPQMIDSTSNSHDGTSAGTMTSGDSVAGKLAGQSLDLDGSNDEINIGTSPNWTSTSTFTWQCWSQTSSAAAKSMLAKGTNSTPFDGINFFLSAGDFRFSMVPTTGIGGQIFIDVTASYDDGAWRMYHATYSGSETAAGMTPYVNGSVPSHTDNGTWSGSLGTTRNLKIGERDGGINWLGKIDEVRFSNVELAGTWISTEYNNQNSPGTFYTAGSQELDPSAIDRRKRLIVVS